MSLTIRKAVAADAEALTDILTRSWEAAYAGIIPEEAIREKNAGRLAMWRRILAAEHNEYLALEGEIPIGLFGLHRCRDDGLTDAGEVGAMYLLPGYWGKGYGRAMMDFALGTLRGQGFGLVTLWVLKENAHARGFYEKCGFALDGAEKEYIAGRQLTVVRYRKELKEDMPW